MSAEQALLMQEKKGEQLETFTHPAPLQETRTSTKPLERHAARWKTASGQNSEFSYLLHCSPVLIQNLRELLSGSGPK